MDKPPIFPVARRVSSCTYYIMVEPQKEEAVKAGKNEKKKTDLKLCWMFVFFLC